jgi:endonuclease G, mitochondrial
LVFAARRYANPDLHSKGKPANMTALRSALAGCLVLLLSACVTRPSPSAVVIESLPAATTEHCLLGCPTGTPSTDVLVRHQLFTLANNGSTKFADWVAYRVIRDAIGPGGDRNWKADPSLPGADTLEPEDYKSASATLGYDRGHQAPLASFGATGFAAETNYLSNITPQKAALNQGAWVRLETAERKLAQTPPYPVVYVITGPLYERDMPGLPKADEPHRVPSGYWKVVALADGRAAAFIFDQMTPRGGSFCDHLVTIVTVETQSKLDIMPEMSVAQTTPLAPALGCAEP